MWITALIFAILVILDQLSKHFTMQMGSETVTIIPNVLEVHKSYNPGAAFGLGGEYTWIWAIVSAIATLVLFVVCYKNDWKHGKFGAIGVTMATAGAFGNFIDRLLTTTGLREGVVDMISWKWFDAFLGLFGGSSNVFNVADAFLIVGLIMLAIDYLFFYERRVRKYGFKDRRK